MYFAISTLFLLGKSVAFHFSKLVSLSLKDALCKVLLKLAQGSGEEDENVKSLRTCGRTKGDQQSLLELSDQVS